MPRLRAPLVALALVVLVPLCAGTATASADTCPIPQLAPLVAGQEGFVPVEHFCPPEADRDPAFWDQTVDFGDGTSVKAPYTQGYTGAVHTYAQPGEYAVTAVLRDTRTDVTRTFTARVVVAAGVPTTPSPPPPAPLPSLPSLPAPALDLPCPMVVPALPPAAGVRGFVFVVQHCPATVDRDVARFAVTIDYGDGTRAPGLMTPDAFLIGGEHAYRRAGTYTVKASIRNLRTGEERTYVRPIVVRAARLTASRRASPRFTVGRKGELRPLAAFTSAPAFRAPTYRATIAWGDGTRSRGTVRKASGSTFTVLGRHRYARARNRPLTVTVVHPTGARVVLRTTALVGRVYDELPR